MRVTKYLDQKHSSKEKPAAALVSLLCKAVINSTIAHQSQDVLHLAIIHYFLHLFLLLPTCQPGGGNTEYLETEDYYGTS